MDKMYHIKTNNSGETEAYDLYPDFCPVCHRSAEIILLSGPPHLFPDECPHDSDKRMQVLWKCPRKTCGSLFIVEYKQKWTGSHWYFAATGIYPSIFKKMPLAEGVQDISPRFVKILQQAAQAESENLDEIAGIGFRKALEFLVKDYCIHRKPTDASAIRASQLGGCIKNFVTDANVKACAQRAAWLGNDEAHYERVWTSHDVTDLKTLIQLTQNWISNELLTDKYMKELDNTKPAQAKPSS